MGKPERTTELDEHLASGNTPSNASSQLGAGALSGRCLWRRGSNRCLLCTPPTPPPTPPMTLCLSCITNHGPTTESVKLGKNPAQVSNFKKFLILVGNGSRSMSCVWLILWVITSLHRVCRDSPTTHHILIVNVKVNTYRLENGMLHIEGKKTKEIKKTWHLP